MSIATVAVETIASRIFIVRGLRVLVDSDLAALYGVPTKRFNQAVKRNSAKFPAEFMFQLTEEEFAVLRSQFVTSNAGRGGRRYLPHVFTEHGALMAAAIPWTARERSKCPSISCALSSGYATFSRETRNWRNT
jgi:ORF6N domain